MVSSIGSFFSCLAGVKDNSFGVSPKTAAVFAVGIGLGAAAACMASSLLQKNVVVLSSDQHQEMVEKIETLEGELKNELLRKTLDSVDPNPDLLDKIESLQEQLLKKNEEASRFMAEYEEELNRLKHSPATRKTLQIAPDAIVSAAKSDPQEKKEKPTIFELQEKIESLQSLSDRNAREAFQAEMAVENLSSQMDGIRKENLGLKEDLSNRGSENLLLVEEIKHLEKEVRQQEREIETLRSVLQGKQEEIDSFPDYMKTQNEVMQENLREEEEAFLKEIYQALGLSLPKKLDLNTAKEDLKLFFRANQKSQVRDNQRWVAAIEALSVLEGRYESA